MMIKKIALLLLSAVLFLSACQKDLDVFVPTSNGPDTSWYSIVTDAMPLSALRNSLLLDTYTDTIDISSSADTVSTASGIQCIFPFNSFVTSGSLPVSGKINVEIALLDKKGDMIRMNRSTTSDNRLLVSAGEIYLKAKKDNDDLFLAPNAKLKVKYPSLSPDTSMKFFAGLESIFSSFDWIINPDAVNNKVTAGNQHYEIETNRLNWYNCAYFFDTAAITRSRVVANIPSSYTNANTAVFIVLKDFNSVINLAADINSKKFISSKLPNGKDATMLVLSKQGNDFFFGQMPFTIGNNTLDAQIVTITPIKTSLTDIKHFLTTL